MNPSSEAVPERDQGKGGHGEAGDCFFSLLSERVSVPLVFLFFPFSLSSSSLRLLGEFVRRPCFLSLEQCCSLFHSQCLDPVFMQPLRQTERRENETRESESTERKRTFLSPACRQLEKHRRHARECSRLPSLSHDPFPPPPHPLRLFPAPPLDERRQQIYTAAAAGIKERSKWRLRPREAAPSAAPRPGPAAGELLRPRTPPPTAQEGGKPTTPPGG